MTKLTILTKFASIWSKWSIWSHEIFEKVIISETDKTDMRVTTA